jgi:hypothetical protein
MTTKDKSSSAEERGMQMMATPMKDIPPLAMAYARHLGQKFGMCGEVFLTAWCHYAQAIENLPCSDDLYKMDGISREWFEANAPAYGEMVAKHDIPEPKPTDLLRKLILDSTQDVSVREKALNDLLEGAGQDERYVAFDQGYVCAVADIIKSHGDETLARDVLMGLGPVDWTKIDKRDLDTLLEAKLVEVSKVRG